MENFGENTIAKVEDDLFKASTNLPEIIAEEENAIGTLVVIVVSAILSITLLFVMAVFIDCRHQKLDKIRQKNPKRILGISIPRCGRSKTVSEDKETFADKMHVEEPTSSNAAAVIV